MKLAWILKKKQKEDYETDEIVFSEHRAQSEQYNPDVQVIPICYDEIEEHE
jgi:hypothetical protein